MDEKPTIHRLSQASDSPDSTSIHRDRKASITSFGHGKSKAEEKERIDALATSPGVTMASFAHLDEKKILRKMDLRLIPMLALLYLLSFLDRGNIGNAKIEGLTEDLNMTGAQYNWYALRDPIAVFFHDRLTICTSPTGPRTWSSPAASGSPASSWRTPSWATPR